MRSNLGYIICSRSNSIFLSALTLFHQAELIISLWRVFERVTNECQEFSHRRNDCGKNEKLPWQIKLKFQHEQETHVKSIIELLELANQQKLHSTADQLCKCSQATNELFVNLHHFEEGIVCISIHFT